jgi:hypothetical protein
MKIAKMLKGILIVSGLILIVIGCGILFMPVAFFGTSGIDLGSNVNLLNEIRPPGGALLASGILIMSGAFVAELTFTSLVFSLLIYLSYGLSRILSIVIDGMPTKALILVTVLEIILGLIGFFALIRYRRTIA